MIPTILQDDKLRFCRVRKGTKKPFEDEWTKKLYTWQEIKKHLPKENYGVLCGHGGIAVIDSDNVNFQLAVENMLPETYRVKTGGGGTHNYFFIPELKNRIVLELDDDKKTHLGEVQSFGQQVVAPSSLHKSGKKYEELNQHPIVTLKFEDLMKAIKPFTKKQLTLTEVRAEQQRTGDSEIDNLSVSDIWGVAGLKNNKEEYYGTHPVHGSAGGMNFWINPMKNNWHCFRCNSGGGVLSAIAVKEGIIQCSDAQRGSLRGDKAFKSIQIAKDKYGLKDTPKPVSEVDKQYPHLKKEKESNEDFELIWLKDLKDYNIEEKDWIIDKLIPTKSVCILTGKRGTLKTFISIAMAYSIASGEPFLETYDTEKGKVIYLDKENGIQIMKKRTRMFEKGLELKDSDLPIGFICFSQIKLDKLGGIAAIEKVIEEHDPSLLIVDTYRRSVSFDENDAGKVSELFVDTLRPIVEKNNCSILLIHHDRKSSGRGESVDEMDEMRGSSDLANYADIILKTERKGKKLILKQLKNRNAEELTPFQIKTQFEENNKEMVKFTYEGEYTKQGQSDLCAEKIIIWIEENEITNFSTADVREVAYKEGYKRSNFHNALITLQDSGLIKIISRGKYQVIKVQ